MAQQQDSSPIDSTQVTKPHSLTSTQLAALLQPSPTATQHSSREARPLGLTGFFLPMLA